MSVAGVERLVEAREELASLLRLPRGVGVTVKLWSRSYLFTLSSWNGSPPRMSSVPCRESRPDGSTRGESEPHARSCPAVTRATTDVRASADRSDEVRLAASVSVRTTPPVDEVDVARTDAMVDPWRAQDRRTKAIEARAEAGSRMSPSSTDPAPERGTRTVIIPYIGWVASLPIRARQAAGADAAAGIGLA